MVVRVKIAAVDQIAKLGRLREVDVWGEDVLDEVFGITSSKLAN